MKLFKRMKDGGSESTVTGYWLIEIKSMFSIVLLRFDNNSREAYHTHAFNCLNWLLKGRLFESFCSNYKPPNFYKPSIVPFVVRREDFHKVDSVGVSWLLSIRGPWSKYWQEYLPLEERYRKLTSGRVEIVT